MFIYQSFVYKNLGQITHLLQTQPDALKRAIIIHLSVTQAIIVIHKSVSRQCVLLGKFTHAQGL